MGEVGRQPDRRPHRRRRLPHPCLALAQQQQRKKREIFVGFFRRQAPGGPRLAVPACRARRRSHDCTGALIAQ